MNHTKKYSLPQWELNDLIRMEDFNSAMANLENGLTGSKTAAENQAAELARKINAANVKPMPPRPPPRGNSISPGPVPATAMCWPFIYSNHQKRCQKLTEVV